MNGDPIRGSCDSDNEIIIDVLYPDPFGTYACQLQRVEIAGRSVMVEDVVLAVAEVVYIGIVAFTADQRVVALAAIEDIGTLAPVKNIHTRPTLERIVTVVTV